MEEVEAREATMPPTVQRVTSTRKNSSAQDISSAEVEKPATASCFCSVSGNSVHWGHYSCVFPVSKSIQEPNCLLSRELPTAIWDLCWCVRADGDNNSSVLASGPILSAPGP